MLREKHKCFPVMPEMQPRANSRFRFDDVRIQHSSEASDNPEQTLATFAPVGKTCGSSLTPARTSGDGSAAGVGKFVGPVRREVTSSSLFPLLPAQVAAPRRGYPWGLSAWRPRGCDGVMEFCVLRHAHSRGCAAARFPTQALQRPRARRRSTASGPSAALPAPWRPAGNASMGLARRIPSPQSAL